MRYVIIALTTLGLSAPAMAGSLAPVAEPVIVEPAPQTGSLGAAGTAVVAGLAVLALIALADDDDDAATTTTAAE
jgi:hypothetical protein